VVPGRRRTDVPDGLWSGTPAQLSDHPTAPGRDRSEAARRPAARPASAAEPARQMSRSRLPLPPVPAAARPAAGARGDLLERPARLHSAPVPPLPSRSWDDADISPAATGPSGRRPSAPLPRVPAQATSSGVSAPVHGDWNASDAEPVAPGTTAIPERPANRRSSERSRGASGPATGGRAAMRAERQAADAVRRKAEGRKGSAVAVLEEDEPRKPRRVLKGLIAMTVVALGVLGVYSFVSPETTETAARTPDASASAATVPDVASLPELPADPIAAEPVAAAPVRVPVTVLNSTDITGLAAKVAAAVAGGGWETPGVGAYEGPDVAASTVFYTDGDENQKQAATQLIEMFPQLQGPTPRFFEVPADVQAPGLVVVTTGDWQP
jgi:LytR cell envelope-related transcriptional attenuator